LSEDPDRSHDFVKPGGGKWSDSDRLLITEGTFSGLTSNPSYRAKKEADRISYAWDRLIEQFSNNILDGTSVAVFGEKPIVSKTEQALRTMALEPRLQRRLLGEAFVTAMERAEKQAQDRFVRVVLPGPHTADRTVAYVFLILAYPKGITLAGGYDQYRKVRTNMLHAYCLHALYEHRNLKRALGIGLDASKKVTGRDGGSEDMLVLEVGEWTPKLEEQARELWRKFDVMDPKRIVKGIRETTEYPLQPKVSSTRTRKKEEPQHAIDRRRQEKLLRQQLREWRKRQKGIQV
jgi:hypothetical protein